MADRNLRFAIICLAVGAVLYYPLLDFSFFWEDPFDIGQVIDHSYADLFRVSTNNLYYRPLSLAIIKSLKGGGDLFRPFPFYLFNILTRIAASYLVFLLGSFLFRRKPVAEVAGVLFLISPIAYDSTAKAMSSHQPMVLLLLIAVLFYLRWRRSERRVHLFLALFFETAALLTHEYAILMPFMVLALEIWLVSFRDGSYFKRQSLYFFGPVAVFIVIWFLIPKSAGAFNIYLEIDNFLFLSQALSFPIAAVLSELKSETWTQHLQAIIAVGLTLIVLAAVYRRNWRVLVMLLVWLALVISLPLFSLSNDYLLNGGQRLFYFPLLVGSLIWAGVGEKIESRPGQIAYLILVFAVALHSIVTLIGLNKAYEEGSRLMRQIVAVGNDHERLLFVNVPDRFEYCDKPYPVGFWGMMFAPVSQGLDDFIYLRSGRSTETVSMSSFFHFFPMVAETQYCVNWRGSDAYQREEMYAAFEWADQVYATVYRADGSFDLQELGTVYRDAPNRTDRFMAQFGEYYQLQEAIVSWEGDEICLTSEWGTVQGSSEDNTLFVHLINEAGQMMTQEDGDVIGGLLPMRVWERGNRVVDTRCLPANGSETAAYFLVGIYNRTTGERLEAVLLEGTAVLDDAVQIAIPQDGE